MPDAEIDNWRQEFQVSAELLRSLSGLNFRFLDLMTAQPFDWDSPRQGLCGAISTALFIPTLMPSRPHGRFHYWVRGLMIAVSKSGVEASRSSLG